MSVGCFGLKWKRIKGGSLRSLLFGTSGLDDVDEEPYFRTPFWNKTNSLSRVSSSERFLRSGTIITSRSSQSLEDAVHVAEIVQVQAKRSIPPPPPPRSSSVGRGYFTRFPWNVHIPTHPATSPVQRKRRGSGLKSATKTPAAKPNLTPITPCPSITSIFAMSLDRRSRSLQSVLGEQRREFRAKMNTSRPTPPQRRRGRSLSRTRMLSKNVRNSFFSSEASLHTKASPYYERSGAEIFCPLELVQMMIFRPLRQRRERERAKKRPQMLEREREKERSSKWGGFSCAQG